MTGVLIVFFTSCNRQRKYSNDKIVFSEVADSNSHGYNQLANPDHKKSFTISDYNTDNPEIKNIDRPSTCIIKTTIDTSLLFNIWTSDPDGPHADFDFSGYSFYVVDYDGDGNMPYELIDHKLKIYYNDFIQEGQIVSVKKDTLAIRWKDFDDVDFYVKWKQ